MSSKKQNKTNSKRHTESIKPVVIRFGQRCIYKANFSRAVSLPKIALANMGIDTGLVDVQLVQENGEKYIKILPTNNTKEVKQ